MRNFTSLVFAFMLVVFCSDQIFAQQSAADLAKIEQNQVKQWILQNPNVKIITFSDFMHAQQDERNELASLQDRFIHKGEMPTWADIQAYETTGEATISLNNLNNEMLQIKQWVAANPQVLVISVNEFSKLDATDRAKVNLIDQKIIYTDVLRWDDIQAYQTNN